MVGTEGGEGRRRGESERRLPHLGAEYSSKQNIAADHSTSDAQTTSFASNCNLKAAPPVKPASHVYPSLHTHNDDESNPGGGAGLRKRRPGRVRRRRRKAGREGGSEWGGGTEDPGRKRAPALVLPGPDRSTVSRRRGGSPWRGPIPRGSPGPGPRRGELQGGGQGQRKTKLRKNEFSWPGSAGRAPPGRVSPGRVLPLSAKLQGQARSRGRESCTSMLRGAGWRDGGPQRPRAQPRAEAQASLGPGSPCAVAAAAAVEGRERRARERGRRVDSEELRR